MFFFICLSPCIVSGSVKGNSRLLKITRRVNVCSISDQFLLLILVCCAFGWRLACLRVLFQTLWHHRRCCSLTSRFSSSTAYAAFRYFAFQLAAACLRFLWLLCFYLREPPALFLFLLQISSVHFILCFCECMTCSFSSNDITLRLELGSMMLVWDSPGAGLQDWRGWLWYRSKCCVDMITVSKQHKV